MGGGGRVGGGGVEEWGRNELNLLLLSTAAFSLLIISWRLRDDFFEYNLFPGHAVRHWYVNYCGEIKCSAYFIYYFSQLCQVVWRSRREYMNG